jgi:hypothetical protein
MTANTGSKYIVTANASAAAVAIKKGALKETPFISIRCFSYNNIDLVFRFERQLPNQRREPLWMPQHPNPQYCNPTHELRVGSRDYLPLLYF